MLFLNDKKQLQVEPSCVPFGTGDVVVADNKEMACEVLAKLITWLTKDSLPAITTSNNVTWHLTEKSVISEYFVLSYYVDPSAPSTILYRGDGLCDVVHWLYKQFEPLTGILESVVS